ncbi:MAG: N-acetylmuramoyl-L-alanine amidase, partial [Spirochaetota bacterium]
MAAKMVLFAGAALAMILFPVPTAQNDDYPLYRVVVDPGHGGVGIEPIEQHGDRYDPISGKY